MTIQEAIKSGKRFRRTVYLDEDWVDQKNVYTLTKEAILADDWEVEETFREDRKFTLKEIETAFLLAERFQKGFFVMADPTPEKRLAIFKDMLFR